MSYEWRITFKLSPFPETFILNADDLSQRIKVHMVKLQVLRAIPSQSSLLAPSPLPSSVMLEQGLCQTQFYLWLVLWYVLPVGGTTEGLEGEQQAKGSGLSCLPSVLTTLIQQWFFNLKVTVGSNFHLKNQNQDKNKNTQSRLTSLPHNPEVLAPAG